MTIIVKPILAATLTSLDELDWKDGFLCTEKLDGIRALKIGEQMVSRTFKPIRNEYINKLLSKILPEGADGEIIVSHTSFQETSSGVMSTDGEPEFTYFWFDWVKDSLDEGYADRIKRMKEYATKVNLPSYIKLLVPQLIASQDQLLKFEEETLTKGFEGVIIRSKDGRYKCGRSTLKEKLLMKFKRFQDDEAVVIGFEEKMHNDNEDTKDAFGRTKRSTKMDGLVPAGTLGALVVRDIKTGVKFNIGTGFDDKMRNEIWKHKKKYENAIVKYKHFAQSGTKDAPRFPVFLGFRDKEDM